MGKNLLTVLMMALICGILGGFLGELLGVLIPAGFFHDLFTRGFSIGSDAPFTLDLRVIVLTFGLKFTVNLLSLAGMIAGLYHSK